MLITQRILLALSRPVETGDYPMSDDDVTVENALALLCEQFGGEILDCIRGKRVLDYGCGYGKQAVAYLLSGAANVTAVDIGQDNLAKAQALAKESGVASRLALVLGNVTEIKLPEESYDTVVTINTFEHFMNPEGVLKVCYPALRPQGRFVITFKELLTNRINCILVKR